MAKLQNARGASPGKCRGVRMQQHKLVRLNTLTRLGLGRPGLLILLLGRLGLGLAAHGGGGL